MMKNKILVSLLSLSLIFVVAFSWVKHLTKIEYFDIFEDIEIDEDN